MTADASHTSATILECLRDPSNLQAWADFASRYKPSIKKWCQKRGLQECDADDVSQKLVTEIHVKIKSFRYDPARGRFRDWLFTVTQHACATFLARDASRKFRELVDDVTARTDFDRELEAENQRELLRIARARVQIKISERDWQIFNELTDRARAAADVGAEYQLSTAAIYMIRHRVLARLKTEVTELGGDVRSGTHRDESSTM
jgi:RNA polymerase sigma factor (sigma-70 family)